MFDNRDNAPRPEDSAKLPPRPHNTFTPLECADEITAQLRTPEIHAATRNSVRCCIDSVPRLSCTASDVIALVSALRPLQAQPFDEDGDNTFDYCLRTLLSTFLSADSSSPDRQHSTIFHALTGSLTHHSQASGDAWAADLVLDRLLVGDIPLTPEEKSALYRELTSRELQNLLGPSADVGKKLDHSCKNERLFDVSEVLFDVVSTLEKEITPLDQPSMHHTLSYVSCWLQHLSELESWKLPPLDAFDNEHTRYLIRESFRFFFAEMIPNDSNIRAHHIYVTALARFFTSYIENLEKTPSTWLIPASEAYCLLCSLALSRDILSTSQALRRLASTPLLSPDGLLTPASYTIKSPRYPNDDFTISGNRRFAYNRHLQRNISIRDVSIEQGSTTLHISFWRDEQLKAPSNVRLALDFKGPKSSISLRGLTLSGLQAYISDGPLCLPTSQNTTALRHTDTTKESIFQNGDYLVPITIAELRHILRLITEAARHVNPISLVSHNHVSLGE